MSIRTRILLRSLCGFDIWRRSNPRCISLRTTVFLVRILNQGPRDSSAFHQVLHHQQPSTGRVAFCRFSTLVGWYLSGRSFTFDEMTSPWLPYTAIINTSSIIASGHVDPDSRWIPFCTPATPCTPLHRPGPPITPQRTHGQDPSHSLRRDSGAYK